MECARPLGLENLVVAQKRMKVQYEYNKRTVERNFEPGDFVLLFNLVKRPLQASYQGHFKVIKKSGSVNCFVNPRQEKDDEDGTHHPFSKDMKGRWSR